MFTNTASETMPLKKDVTRKAFVHAGVGLGLQSLCTTYSTAWGGGGARVLIGSCFKRVQSRRDFSFIAHEKKRKEKQTNQKTSQGIYTTSLKMVAPPTTKSLEPAAWFTLGWTLLFIYFIIYLFIMF